jgi:hypothetical protein
VPGADLPALRQAEALRVAHQAARGGRQVLRPVVYGGAASLHTLTAYLIDEGNPTVETPLLASEPDGIDWGISEGVRRDIVFLLAPGQTPGAAALAGYWFLRTYFDWAISNLGAQPAKLYAKVGLRAFDLHWSGDVTWANRPAGYDGLSIGTALVDAYCGDNGYDYYEVNESIEPGLGMAPTLSMEALFSQTLEDDPGATPWNGFVKVATNVLPKAGFVMSAQGSNRTYTPVPGPFPGNPAETDEHVVVACKYYGYSFSTER